MLQRLATLTVALALFTAVLSACGSSVSDDGHVDAGPWSLTDGSGKVVNDADPSIGS